MQHYYLIWVPKYEFEQHPGIYSSFYIFEILMILFQLTGLPFLIFRMYSTRPLHRNIRLIIVSCLSFTGISSLCRLALLFFQYKGIPHAGSGSTPIIFFASLGRVGGLGVLIYLKINKQSASKCATTC
ncbi:hypothetical protein PMAYCL1PPCAC_27143 [Pristionchus mayeri]|uniref:G protein-coupled receptor n=1 Tax=Pristionchus mayeri TaxID=1317129 RepID=A0AAN5D5L0_9BILA|nr:hypothetical protein PMAYCL1PPCAC_27143 [Pristionchus mayeri]